MTINAFQKTKIASLVTGLIVSVALSTPLHAEVDSDNDGLSDQEEASIGTDPFNWDTDNDGLNDGEEVIYSGTSPFNWDTDNDGLSDGREVNESFTDPLRWDTDGDGVSDTEEHEVTEPAQPGYRR